jgi:hypothetical protein
MPLSRRKTRCFPLTGLSFAAKKVDFCSFFHEENKETFT